MAVDAKAGRLYVTATGQLPQPDGTLDLAYCAAMATGFTRQLEALRQGSRL